MEARHGLKTRGATGLNSAERRILNRCTSDNDCRTLRGLREYGETTLKEQDLNSNPIDTSFDLQAVDFKQFRRWVRAGIRIAALDASIV